MFFKGALLNDAEGVLVSPEENTQASRQIKFTNVLEVDRMESIIKA